MKPLLYGCVCAGLLLPLAAGAQTRTYISDEVRYQEFLKSGDITLNSPFIHENGIVFFFKGEAKTVVVAGDFNDWRPELLMEKHENGIWTRTWDERLLKGTYRYKLIIDHFWMPDPFNTNYILDPSGQKVSTFTLEEDFIPNKKFPLHLQGQTWLFQFVDFNARHVALVGDFNNWDPYTHPMEYKGAGVYEARIKLKPGIHTYCFVVDDEWVPDPNNLRQFADATGAIINVLQAGK